MGFLAGVPAAPFGERGWGTVSWAGANEGEGKSGSRMRPPTIAGREVFSGVGRPGVAGAGVDGGESPPRPGDPVRVRAGGV